MSEFDFGFGCCEGMGDVDTDRGTAILTQFNNAMVNLYGTQYPLSVSDLIAKYPAGIIEGIGLAANSANLSTSDTGTAMVTLAKQGGGLIPASWNDYIGALQSQAAPSGWMNATETALNAVQPIVQPILQAGQSALSTVNAIGNLSALAPLFLYGFAGLIVYSLWKDRDTLARDVGRSARSAAGTATGAAMSAATGGLLNLAGSAKRMIE
jgi:hypothetical protein